MNKSDLNSQFALFLFGCFFIFGLYFFIIKEIVYLGWIFLFLSIAVVFIFFVNVTFFSYPVKLWISLGDNLGRIFNPIVMGILFFILITPISLITRIFGRDELELKRSRVQSYWIYKNKLKEDSKSFYRQF
jgi:hypothetical protein